MASKDSKRGKAFELWVGRRLGARRRRSGEGLGYDDVVEENGFSLPIGIECKNHSRLQLPMAWVEQAKRNAGPHRPWVIVQRPKGSRTVYATMDFEFFLALFDIAKEDVAPESVE